jgi:predicted glycoside hydrolase/deacetylase ChbG (UPF0249 family)
MSPTLPDPSLLERLGLDPKSRCVVLHCDDIGMCHAANEGAFEVLENGPATCGSVMVPCPAFDAAASHARERPDLDLGVHLTLTAEWPDYHWGPVSDPTRVPSLIDARGAFPRTAAEVVERANPREVEIELRAQIERALEAGIDVSHLDSHMGTVLFPPLIDVYVRLALDYRLPVLAVPASAPALAHPSLASLRDGIAAAVRRLEAGGVPIFDDLDSDSLHFDEGQGLPHNLTRLHRLKPGLTYLICHPARAGEELSRIAPDAHCRDFERSFYGGEIGRSTLAEEGILSIGMRPLRDLMRAR